MKNTLAMRIAALTLCLLIILSAAGCRKSSSGDKEFSEWSYYENYEDVPSGEKNSPGDKANENSGVKTKSKGGETDDSKSDSGTKTGGKTMSREFLNSLKGMTINITDLYKDDTPQKGTAIGNMYFANLNKVASKYGITLKYKITNLDQAALQASFLAGNPEVDVFSCQDYLFPSYITSGSCADLTAAMKTLGLNLKEDWYDSNVTSLYNINNKQVAYASGTRDVLMIAYNKRIINEHGLTDPYTLYEKGEWNYNKLAQYAESMLTKSKDGSTQVWGFMSPSAQTLFEMLVYNNGGSLINIKNGKFDISCMSDSKTIQALNYFHDWYVSNKIIEIGMSTWQEPYDTFIAGKIGMFLTGDYLFSRIQEKGGMSDTIGIVPFPKGPSGAKTNESYMNCWPTAVVKSREKDAAKYLYIMNEFYKLQYEQQANYCKTKYGSVIRDSKAYKAYFKRLTNAVKMDLTYMKASGTIFEDGGYMGFTMAIFANNQTPSAAVSAYKGVIPNVINDIWGDSKFTGFN